MMSQLKKPNSHVVVGKDDVVVADTVPKLLIRNYEKWSDSAVVMRRKTRGIWEEFTWKDYYLEVKHLSLGLVYLGLKFGDRVAILGDIDPEWHWSQLAIQAAGGISVQLYPDSSPPEVKYIIDHSDSKILLVNDQEQIDKALQIKDELPKLNKVIYWDPKGLWGYEDHILMSFKELQQLGKDHEKSDGGLFEENIGWGKGSDVANLYYTSGTTGLPKGAMVTQASLLSSGRRLVKALGITEEDNLVAIPHVEGNIMEDIMITCSHLLVGAVVNYAEEPETFQEDSMEISPHAIAYVPRQWEGIVRMAKVRMLDADFLERLVYDLFLPVGYRTADFHYYGKRPNFLWRLLHSIGNMMLFKSLRDRGGLNKCKLGLSGSAMLGPDVFRYMNAIGISLGSMYCLTEAGVVSSHTHAGTIKYETVGTISPGVEVRVSDEGELRIKSDRLFREYYNNPEATKKAMDGRWYCTGDAGYVDDDGDVIFYDRLEDLRELATGAKYSPQYIESRLRFRPYIKDAIILGDKEKDYVSAIINIDFDNVGKWAENHSIPYTTFVDLSQKEEIAKLLKEETQRINRLLPEPARIKKYVLLHKEFDADDAELTRTKKLRREFVEQRYREIISAIYEGEKEASIGATVKYRDGRTGLIKTALKIRLVEEIS